jgi:hypothetical protein
MYMQSCIHPNCVRKYLDKVHWGRLSTNTSIFKSNAVSINTVLDTGILVLDTGILVLDTGILVLDT